MFLFVVFALIGYFCLNVISAFALMPVHSLIRSTENPVIGQVDQILADKCLYICFMLSPFVVFGDSSTYEYSYNL